jgi:hypothetical protein
MMGVPILAGVGLFAGSLATLMSCLIDGRRKTIELLYDLDPVYAEQYRLLLFAFEQFLRSERVWHIDSEGTVDRKYNAGAQRSITRVPVAPRFVLPKYFKSNVISPMLPAGRQTLFLFPDTVLVFDGARVGAVGYSQLLLSAGVANFVEEEQPPRDATVVGQTWRFVNKSGGPDRRFANNRQIPIMAYGAIKWQSHTGLNEENQASRQAVVNSNASEVRAMATIVSRTPRSRSAPLPPPPLQGPTSATPWPAV